MVWVRLFIGPYRAIPAFQKKRRPFNTTHQAPTHSKSSQWAPNQTSNIFQPPNASPHRQGRLLGLHPLPLKQGHATAVAEAPRVARGAEDRQEPASFNQRFPLFWGRSKTMSFNGFNQNIKIARQNIKRYKNKAVLNPLGSY